MPLFRTVYAPVKQLISAFSPDNEFGFKRMVLVEDAARGFLLGFLTKEFTVDRGRGPETLLAVYVPTNHLYLGDVIVCPPERASFPRHDRRGRDSRLPDRRHGPARSDARCDRDSVDYAAAPVCRINGQITRLPDCQMDFRGDRDR